jgi:hypothetical protein
MSTIYHTLSLNQGAERAKIICIQLGISLKTKIGDLSKDKEESLEKLGGRKSFF